MEHPTRWRLTGGGFEWKLAELSKQRLTGSLETQIKCVADVVGPCSFAEHRPSEGVPESLSLWVGI